MAYGVQPEGFVLKILENIQADIVARLVGSPAVGPSQDYSSTAPLGQIVGAAASEIAEVWELGQKVHLSGDPEGALGVPLDQLLSLTGSERQGNRPSVVTGIVMRLEAGALVPAGSLASVEDRPDLVFALDVDVENTTEVEDDFLLGVNGDAITFSATEDAITSGLAPG